MASIASGVACKCGCGKEVRFNKQGKPNTYVRGHNPAWNLGKGRGVCINCGQDRNRGSANQLCKKCYAARRHELTYPQNRAEIITRQIARNRLLRRDVITKLGGVCGCCGEKDFRFLTIDHVRGDGATHRKRVRTYGVLKEIANEGYPKDKYQVLCYNCNCAKSIYKECPHKIPMENQI